MRPFFPYYGSKWRSSRLYGKPRHTILVEPFAGSAGYATYWDHPCTRLFDLDENIVAVWRYLIGASQTEILALPNIEPGEPIADLAVTPEAKILIGFWANRGSASPKATLTSWAARTERAQSVWGARARERIASQLDGIRQWRIEQASYEQALGYAATWFIDPPYVEKGRYYRKRFHDYTALAEWCFSRRGQVIVCEGANANWLPFEPIGERKSTRGKAIEMCWRRDSDVN